MPPRDNRRTGNTTTGGERFAYTGGFTVPQGQTMRGLGEAIRTAGRPRREPRQKIGKTESCDLSKIVEIDKEDLKSKCQS